MPRAHAAVAALADEDTRVDRAREGDARAWTEIVEDLGPTLRGYARARGIRDADDVMQDVFVAAASRIGDFEGDWKSFRSWMFSICYRQIVNRYRSKHKDGVALPMTLADEAEPSPEEAIVSQVEASQAMRALNVLSEIERDVVLMRVIGDLDTGEVADAVGKTKGNVRVIQHRAMEKIRAELERLGYGNVADDKIEKRRTR